MAKPRSAASERADNARRRRTRGSMSRASGAGSADDESSPWTDRARLPLRGVSETVVRPTGSRAPAGADAPATGEPSPSTRHVPTRCAAPNRSPPQ